MRLLNLNVPSIVKTGSKIWTREDGKADYELVSVKTAGENQLILELEVKRNALMNFSLQYPFDYSDFFRALDSKLDGGSGPEGEAPRLVNQTSNANLLFSDQMYGNKQGANYNLRQIAAQNAVASDQGIQT